MLKLRILATTIMGLVLALGSVAPQHSAAKISPAAAAAPSVQANFKLPGSDASDTGKWPRAEAAGNTVHIVSNPGRRVTYWTKSDTSGSVSSPIDLGSVTGNTTYANAALAVDGAGTVYVVWINQGSGIYMRTKTVNGSWSSNLTVNGTSNPLFYVDVAVSTTGQIVVVWNESALFRYRYSNNGGGSWSGTGLVSSKTPRGEIRVASGPNGSLMTAFGTAESSGRSGHVYAGIWNGTGFDNTDIVPGANTGADFLAEPAATIAPNGKYYIAWRRVGGGLYYAERQSNGTWGISRVIDGPVYSEVAISADSGSNLHFAWAGEPSGKWDIWYAFKPVNGDLQGPTHLSDDGLFVANPDLASSINGSTAFGHVVYEAFSGGSNDRYTSFTSTTVAPLSAQPVIEGGDATTKKTTVSVGFTSVQGSPKEIRWRWGAAPTDATNDSGGWVAYANPKSVPLPTSRTSCTALTLYTQVKDGANIESTVKSDSITFDNTVQANVRIVNPFLAGLPQTFAQVSDVGVSDSDGAYDGDPTYTRIPQFFLSINSIGDCSGLKSFDIPASSFSGTISGGQYQNKITLPQAANTTPGSTQTIGVTIRDNADNPGNYSSALTYDPANTSTTQGVTNTAGLPVLNSGSVSADSNNSIVRTLSFSGVNVTDNVYGTKENLPSGREFWGVWIANSRTANLGVHDPSLKWSPVRVAGPNSSFSVQWNIFSGLNIGPDRTKTGDYYVYVRFLDGAGNATKTMLTPLKVTLTPGYTIPTYSLPIVRK